VAEAHRLGATWCVEACDADADAADRKLLLGRALAYDPTSGPAQARLCALAKDDGFEPLRTCLATLADKQGTPDDIVAPLRAALAAHDQEVERQKLLASTSPDDWRDLVKRFPDSGEAKAAQDKIARFESLCADSDRFTALLRKSEREMRTAVGDARAAGFKPVAMLHFLGSFETRAKALDAAVADLRTHQVKADEKAVQAALIASMTSLAKGNRMVGDELQAALDDRDHEKFNEVLLGFEQTMHEVGPELRNTYSLIDGECQLTTALRGLSDGGAQGADSSDGGTGGGAPAGDDDGTDAKHPSLPTSDDGFVDKRGGWGWGDKCWIHIKAGKWGWAKAECDKGMAIADPGAPQPRASLLYNEGLIAKAAGDVGEARKDFQQSLGLREHPEVRAALDSLPAP
jgi:hypothetical protein